MQRGLKGARGIRGSSREADEDLAGCDPVDMQALRLQPAADGIDIRVRRSEAQADLDGSEPMMVVRRSRILLLGEKLFESLLGLRGSRQYHGESLHRLRRLDGAGVIGGNGPRGMVMKQRL